MQYTLSDFDYNLPNDLIAQEPAHPRDHARLLVYNRVTSEITDDYFYNLLKYLDPQTTLVLNNSKVEKARLLFDNKEVFIVQARNNNTVEAMVRPGRKFKLGQTLELTDGITAKITHIAEDGLRTLVFNKDLDDPVYDPYRHTPFPPYIKQNELLADEYQTVYARDLGSKAAPTAGLHFTKKLLRNIEEAGIDKAEVTLHVGLGTFAPVKTENIEEHNLHSEWFEIDDRTAKQLNAANHMTAIGTTSVRVLESSIQDTRRFHSHHSNTEIFIKPGYEFKAVDNLITNFHLPKSTLLMLVAAFMGYEPMRRVYKHAIKEKYRFYSFGDAMLIK
ncbi:MAG TPA: tRNA preQ1(34) S-adenosylmethionine ribosyltransferase-isomerase QueA [Balneolales bacterium]|nr:tRNA preQ1(34) S-adenosylmethionine ribosyltransferase-isomerase QueA [Balneolales bacterium]